MVPAKLTLNVPLCAAKLIEGANVGVPVFDQLPYTFNKAKDSLVDPLIAVIDVVPIEKLAQFTFPEIVIAPEPELESINTLSADVGTEAPPEPPDEVAQWVVSYGVQYPAPPTQYLLAIYFFVLWFCHNKPVIHSLLF